MIKKKKITYLIIFILLVIFITFQTIAYILYENVFGTRICLPTHSLMLSLDDFGSMKRERMRIKSNNSQSLTGYLYTSKTAENDKGLIILSHGMNRTHTDYLGEINTFINNNFKVFAYDNTGYYESEGGSVVGLRQAPIDLEYVLKFIENREEFKNLPIMLYGHSLGGYAVSSVLNYKHNIKAVVVCSGFNNTAEELAEQAASLYGNLAKVIKPFLYLHETFKFGNSTNFKALNGVNNSNAKVLVLHSSEDDVVRLKCSLFGSKDKFKNKDQVLIKLFNNKGHYITSSARGLKCREKRNQINTELKKRYGRNIPVDALKSGYSKLDKKILFELDANVMKLILDFYNKVT